MIGNLIQKAQGATNDTFINYGREAKIRVYYDNETKQPPGNTHYDIYRSGRPTGEQFYAKYRYGEYLYSWDSLLNTKFNGPDVRIGDVLKWNNGVDFLVAGPGTGWDWNSSESYGRQLYISGNTFVNDSGKHLVRAHIDADKILMVNNLIVDRTKKLKWDAAGARPKRELPINNRRGNKIVFTDPGLFYINDFNYGLTGKADGVIDSGSEWGTSDSGYSLEPVFEYRHPLGFKKRDDKGLPDIGAYAVQ